MGDSGFCNKYLDSNEILRRAMSALHDVINRGYQFSIYDDVLDTKKRYFSLLTEFRQTLKEEKDYSWFISRKSHLPPDL